MSLIKRSDVKSHLSTRARGVVLPFKPASQPDASGDSGSELRDSKPNAQSSGNAVGTSTVTKPPQA